RQVREAGLGDLMAQLEQLKRRLHAEGLFENEHKRALPLLPRRVGVVTAPTGAAIRDILTTLADRYPTRVLLYPAKVQGPGSAAEIAEGIGALDAHPEVDVIIAGRGGGSIEDLWAFNEEVVVRAIAAATTPVVSAVGHEPDVLLSDLVADARAATPTAAAELVVPQLQTLRYEVNQIRTLMGQALTRRIGNARTTLTSLENRLTDPRRLVAERRQQVDGLRFRLQGRLQAQLSQARERRTGLAGRLKNLHPSHRVQRGKSDVEGLRGRMKVAMGHQLMQGRRSLAQARSALRVLSPVGCLERGYAIARAADGSILRDAKSSAPGQGLEILLHQGALDVTVNATRARHGLETEGT
ncbi:MAG: exodeoxyribonuclease VII large subunit, partial [Myxococcota bacterium]|nr:exodeoxyribonuclease VII large subunit [Myxococcota bacterium]